MIGITLLKPHFLGIRNRWRKHLDWRGQAGQDAVLAVFSLGLMLGIYQGARWMLANVNANPNLVYLAPAQPLSFIFLLLLGMMLLSAVAYAVGTLFLAEDADLLSASPIRPWAFFSGKFLYIFTLSAWMPLVFLLPVILAFGRAYQAPFSYYLLAPLYLLPYFAVPIAAAIVLATITTALIPANRTKELLAGVIVLVAIGLYFVVELLRASWASSENPADFLRVVTILALPQVRWLPSHWLGICFQELIAPSGREVTPYLCLLLSSALSIVSLAFVLVKSLYLFARSKARNNRAGYKLSLWRNGKLSWLAAKRFNLAQASLHKKEFTLCRRDITQTVQIFMLIGISVLYLSNLRLFVMLEAIPENLRSWWQHFFFLSNFMLCAFIVTAICTRFVYPSISLEGRSFWVLQAAPFPLEKFVQTKFKIWYLPIAIIGVIIFGCSAIAVGAHPSVVCLSMLFASLLSYSVAGLAVGCGAKFANFTWEHASQLAAGFGSVMFMLLATFMIGLNLIPAWFLLAALADSGGEMSTFGLMLCATVVFWTAWIDIGVGRVALRSGTKALAVSSEES
jgi:ABC-2 type transport system permease protein